MNSKGGEEPNKGERRGRKNVSTRYPESVYKQIQAEAKDLGVSASEFARGLVLSRIIAGRRLTGAITSLDAATVDGGKLPAELVCDLINSKCSNLPNFDPVPVGAGGFREKVAAAREAALSQKLPSRHLTVGHFLGELISDTCSIEDCELSDLIAEGWVLWEVLGSSSFNIIARLVAIAAEEGTTGADLIIAIIEKGP